MLTFEERLPGCSGGSRWLLKCRWRLFVRVDQRLGASYIRMQMQLAAMAITIIMGLQLNRLEEDKML